MSSPTATVDENGRRFATGNGSSPTVAVDENGRRFTSGNGSSGKLCNSKTVGKEILKYKEHHRRFCRSFNQARVSDKFLSETRA